jgi:uncharacterized protein
MTTYLSPGVYIEEREPGTVPIDGVGTSVVAFVGLTAKGPLNEAKLVTNWTQYVTQFGEPVAGSYLGQSVYGFFVNGGGRAYIVRIGAPLVPEQTACTPRAELTAGGDAALSAYVATALTAGEAPVVVEVTDPDEGASEESFRLIVRCGEKEEVYGPVSAKHGRSNVLSAVNKASKLIRIEEAGAPLSDLARRPANGLVTLTRPSAGPAGPAQDDYVGSAAQRTGFGALETLDTVNIVCVPDLVAAYEAGTIDGTAFRAVQTAMIDHCELMGDRMAILDPLPDMTAQEVYDWRMDVAGYDSKYAALYYPMLTVLDQDSGNAVQIPPSGYIAGVWASNDATRGVHKAPANHPIRGIIGVANPITPAEHDLLNPVGVNCIRPFRGRGIRVWGARTLSNDATWRYVNVRRLYNYVESSLRNGTQWVVFEPNDRALWERVVRTIRSFLFRVWLDGALFGETADEAFYVRCNDELNPSETIEAGQLVCEIGMAVVKPAEFVIFRLAQLATGNSSINE